MPDDDDARRESGSILSAMSWSLGIFTLAFLGGALLRYRRQQTGGLRLHLRPRH